MYKTNTFSFSSFFPHHRRLRKVLRLTAYPCVPLFYIYLKGACLPKGILCLDVCVCLLVCMCVCLFLCVRFLNTLLLNTGCVCMCTAIISHASVPLICCPGINCMVGWSWKWMIYPLPIPSILVSPPALSTTSLFWRPCCIERIYITVRFIFWNFGCMICFSILEHCIVFCCRNFSGRQQTTYAWTMEPTL